MQQCLIPQAGGEAIFLWHDVEGRDVARSLMADWLARQAQRIPRESGMGSGPHVWRSPSGGCTKSASTTTRTFTASCTANCDDDYGIHTTRMVCTAKGCQLSAARVARRRSRGDGAARLPSVLARWSTSGVRDCARARFRFPTACSGTSTPQRRHLRARSRFRARHIP